MIKSKAATKEYRDGWDEVFTSSCKCVSRKKVHVKRVREPDGMREMKYISYCCKCGKKLVGDNNA